MDLVTLLQGLKGSRARFVRLESKTLARATKKSRATLEPFSTVFGCAEIYKIDSRNLLINAAYERVVNRRREASGLDADFQSEGTYGAMDGLCLLTREDGSKQMRTYHLPSKRDNSRWVKSDGTDLTEKEIARLKTEFLPVPSENKKQGLDSDKTFRPLNFKLESIRGIKIDGQDYILAGV